MNCEFQKILSRNLIGFGILVYNSNLLITSAVGEEILGVCGLSGPTLIMNSVEKVSVFQKPKIVNNFREGLQGKNITVEVKHGKHHLNFRFSPVFNEKSEVTGGMLVIQDITDFVASREALYDLAVKDELTGVYNRRGFMLLAGQQMKLANRNSSGSLLFFMDLNDLKIVNDTIGHQVGDECLKDAAFLLTKVFRESDIIGRYGGDEFVVFVNDVPPEVEILIQERIIDVLGEFNSHPKRYKISFSVGSSYLYQNKDKDKTLEELITEADKKMYDRKKQYKKLYTDSSYRIQNLF